MDKNKMVDERVLKRMMNEYTSYIVHDIAVRMYMLIEKIIDNENRLTVEVNPINIGDSMTLMNIAINVGVRVGKKGELTQMGSIPFSINSETKVKELVEEVTRNLNESLQMICEEAKKSSYSTNVESIKSMFFNTTKH